MDMAQITTLKETKMARTTNFFSSENESKMGNLRKSFTNVTKESSPEFLGKVSPQFGQAYQKSRMLTELAGDIYWKEGVDPREEVSKVLLGDVIAEKYGKYSDEENEYFRKNASVYVKAATGYDLDAKSIWEILGNKVNEGFSNTFNVAIPNIAWMINTTLAKSPEEKQYLRDVYDKKIAEGMKNRRTDYFKEFDSFVDDLLMSTASFLPSVLPTIPVYALGAFFSAPTGGTSLAVAKLIAGGYSGLVEGANAMLDLKQAGASEETSLLFGSIYGVIASYIEAKAGDVIQDKMFGSLRRAGELFNKSGKFLEKDFVGRTAVEILKQRGSEYVASFVTEPAEEMAQEFSQKIITELAKLYEDAYGEPFADYETIDNIIKDVAQVGLETLKGNVFLGLGSNALSLGIDQFTEFKYARQARKNAGEDFEITNDTILADIPQIRYNEKAESVSVEEGKGVGAIRGIRLSDNSVVVHPEDSGKMKYIKKKAGSSKHYGVYVNIVNDMKVDGNAMNNQSTVLYATGLLSGFDDVRVSGNKITVKDTDYNKAISTIVLNTGSEFRGLSEENGITKIQIGDKVIELIRESDSGNNYFENINDAYKNLSEDLKKNGMSSIDFDTIEANRVFEIYKDKNIKKDFKKAYSSANSINNANIKNANEKYMPTAFNKIFDAYKNATKMSDKRATAFTNASVIVAQRMANALGQSLEEFIGDIDFAIMDEKTVNEAESKGEIKRGSFFDNVIKLSKYADATTAIHEMAHLFLTKADVNKIANFKSIYSEQLKKDNAGNDNSDTWTVGKETQEEFAKDFEKYIRKNEVKDSSLRKIFEQLRMCFVGLRTSLSKELSNEAKKMFDELLGEDVVIEEKAKQEGIYKPQKIELESSDKVGLESSDELIDETELDELLMNVFSEEANKPFIEQDFKKDAEEDADGLMVDMFKYDPNASYYDTYHDVIDSLVTAYGYSPTEAIIGTKKAFDKKIKSEYTETFSDKFYDLGVHKTQIDTLWDIVDEISPIFEDKLSDENYRREFTLPDVAVYIAQNFPDTDGYIIDAAVNRWLSNTIEKLTAPYESELLEEFINVGHIDSGFEFERAIEKISNYLNIKKDDAEAILLSYLAEQKDIKDHTDNLNLNVGVVNKDVLFDLYGNVDVDKSEKSMYEDMSYLATNIGLPVVEMPKILSRRYGIKERYTTKAVNDFLENLTDAFKEYNHPIYMAYLDYYIVENQIDIANTPVGDTYNMLKIALTDRYQITDELADIMVSKWMATPDTFTYVKEELVHGEGGEYEDVDFDAISDDGYTLVSSNTEIDEKLHLDDMPEEIIDGEETREADEWAAHVANRMVDAIVSGKKDEYEAYSYGNDLATVSVLPAKFLKGVIEGGGLTVPSVAIIHPENINGLIDTYAYGEPAVLFAFSKNSTIDGLNKKEIMTGDSFSATRGQAIYELDLINTPSSNKHKYTAEEITKKMIELGGASGSNSRVDLADSIKHLHESLRGDRETETLHSLKFNYDAAILREKFIKELKNKNSKEGSEINEQYINDFIVRDMARSLARLWYTYVARKDEYTNVTYAGYSTVYFDEDKEMGDIIKATRQILEYYLGTQPSEELVNAAVKMYDRVPNYFGGNASWHSDFAEFKPQRIVDIVNNPDVQIWLPYTKDVANYAKVLKDAGATNYGMYLKSDLTNNSSKLFDLLSEDIVNTDAIETRKLLGRGGMLTNFEKDLLMKREEFNKERIKDKLGIDEGMSIPEMLKTEETISALFKSQPELIELVKEEIEKYSEENSLMPELFVHEDWEKIADNFVKKAKEFDDLFEYDGDMAWAVLRINAYLNLKNPRDAEEEWLKQFNGKKGNTNLKSFVKELGEKTDLLKIYNKEKDTYDNPSTETIGRIDVGAKYPALSMMYYQIERGQRIIQSVQDEAKREIADNVKLFRNEWLTWNDLYSEVYEQEAVEDNFVELNEEKKEINKYLSDEDVSPEMKKIVKNGDVNVKTIKNILDRYKVERKKIDLMGEKIANLTSDLVASGNKNKELKKQISDLRKQRNAAYKKLFTLKDIELARKMKDYLENQKKRIASVAKKKAGYVKTQSTLNRILAILSSNNTVNMFDYGLSEKDMKDFAKNTYNYMMNVGIVSNFGEDYGEIVLKLDEMPSRYIDGLLDAFESDYAKGRDKVADEKKEAVRNALNIANGISATFKGMELTDEDEAIIKERMDDKGDTREEAESYAFDRKLLRKIHKGSKTDVKRNKGFFSSKLNLWFTNPDTILNQISPEMSKWVMNNLNKYESTKLKNSRLRKEALNKVLAEIYGIQSENIEKLNKDIPSRLANYVEDFGTIDSLKGEELMDEILKLPSDLSKIALNLSKRHIPENNDVYTKAQAMGIYVRTLNKEGLEHLVTSTNNISIGQALWIRKQFETNPEFAEMRKVADAIVQTIGGRFSEISKIVLKLDNRELKFVKNYMPNVSIDHRIQLDITEQEFQEHPSLAKYFTIDQNGGGTPVNLDIISELDYNIEAQEAYIAGAEIFREFDMVFNGKGNLLGKIEAQYNKKVRDFVENFIEINRARRVSDLAEVGKTIGKLRSNMALAKLGLNLSSATQQFASLPLALQRYNGLQIASAMMRVAKGGKKYVEDNVYSVSEQMRQRANMEINYAQQMSIGNGKLSKLRAKFAEGATWVMRQFDKYCAAVLFDVSYRDNIEKGMSIEDAEMDATQWVLDIQSNTSVKNNPLIYSSSSDLVKTLLLFTNQLNKQYNMAVSAIYSKDGKRIASTLLALGLSTAWVCFVTGKFLPTPDADDDEWKNWFKAVGVETLGMLPLGNIAKGVFEGYSYGDTSMVGVDQIQKIAQMFTTVTEKDKGKKAQKVKTAAKNLLYSAEDIAGAPSVATKRLFQSGELLAEGHTISESISPWFGSEWREFVEGK